MGAAEQIQVAGTDLVDYQWTEKTSASTLVQHFLDSY
jgi:hypothetical protein